VLKGRCGCNRVAFEVADEFVVAYNCHCSNCRAWTGSAFMPWGEVERDTFTVTKGGDALTLLGDADAIHEAHCAECLSLVYWIAPDRAHVRIPYGTLIDEPTLKPTAHMFVGSKAPWYGIADDLPQHDEYPGDS
jgi:hypothetical protein